MDLQTYSGMEERLVSSVFVDKYHDETEDKHSQTQRSKVSRML
jgi:hypothetical protein